MYRCRVVRYAGLQRVMNTKFNLAWRLKIERCLRAGTPRRGLSAGGVSRENRDCPPVRNGGGDGEVVVVAAISRRDISPRRVLPLDVSSVCIPSRGASLRAPLRSPRPPRVGPKIFLKSHGRVIGRSVPYFGPTASSPSTLEGNVGPARRRSPRCDNGGPVSDTDLHGWHSSQLRFTNCYDCLPRSSAPRTRTGADRKRNSNQP